jgi:hypothetical protein
MAGPGRICRFDSMDRDRTRALRIRQLDEQMQRLREFLRQHPVEPERVESHVKKIKNIPLLSEQLLKDLGSTIN